MSRRSSQRACSAKIKGRGSSKGCRIAAGARSSLSPGAVGEKSAESDEDVELVPADEVYYGELWHIGTKTGGETFAEAGGVSQGVKIA